VPYPAAHRLAIREKIVASARRLFNRHGFDNVSVKQIMAGAGLTHGGFYSYFKGKSDLYTEVLGCFFTDPNWKNHWRDVEVDLASPDARRAFEAVFQAMVVALEKAMGNKSATRRSKAQAIAALCVGGLVVARAMSSSAAADELRAACMNVALEF
jgi:TetR/AcrR family transcriptional repressor of nem operon